MGTRTLAESADSRTGLAAALVSRLVAGALGWLLIGAGVLGVGYTLVRALGPAPQSAVGSTLALAASLAAVAVGVYGHPGFRERLRARRD
ncbi:hypothetical protein GCM10009037_10180 [Halarchaeum grantii]|uniref:Uncharacterized protein n=1 Tax=Halarchaeum grantii TaxID=1193105 RepID=A0A830EVE7_9EURY|nr:hypothetical protein [Halarchaeum grantii]GGL28491.1 hypothetical protein GCM10009037_10180 [Halarchaeum grantii]